MSKYFLTAVAAFALVILPITSAFAGTDEDIEVLKRMLERQQAEIDGLKAKLAADEKAELTTAEKLDAFIESDGEAIDAEPGKGIWSLKSEWFELGGELEFDFHDVQSEKDPNVVTAWYGGYMAGGPANVHTGSMENSFDIDKVALCPKVTLSDKLYMQGEFTYNEGATTVSEWWAHFTLPSELYFKVGRFRRSARDPLPTESWGLFGTFFKQRTTGFQLGGEHAMNEGAKLYWAFSLMNGYALGSDNAGGDSNNQFPIMGDRSENADSTNFKETGLSLGLTHDLRSLGKVDFQLSYYKDTLNRNELDTIINPILFANGLYRNMADPGTAYGRYQINNDRDRTRFFARLNYSYIDFVAQFHYMTAADSKLERSAWEFYIGNKFNLPGIEYGEEKWFTAIMPYISYASYDVDKYDGQIGVGSRTLDSYTWDRELITLALTTDVTKNTKFRIEYYICDEDLKNKKVAAWAGMPQFPSSVDNDELLMQLEIKF